MAEHPEQLHAWLPLSVSWVTSALLETKAGSLKCFLKYYRSFFRSYWLQFLSKMVGQLLHSAKLSFALPPRHSGFRQNTDPRSTDPLLTPSWLPYWPPIKSMGKWEFKKPRTINGTRFKFINKFSLPETFKMADALQISDSCSPSTEGFVTKNRARNKLEYQQAWYLYPLENQAIKIATKFWQINTSATNRERDAHDYINQRFIMASL